MKIALFKRLGKPYDPVKTKDRPWMSHLKRKIVSPEESIYYYMKYTYPDIKIKLITRNNLPEKVKYLNENFDIVFLGLEDPTSAFFMFSEMKAIYKFKPYIKALQNIKNLYPKYDFIDFILNKYKYINFLKSINVNTPPTRFFNLNNKTIKNELIKNDWGKLFIKTIPGAEASNSIILNKKNLQTTKLNNKIKELKEKKYNKILVQKYIENFATSKYPELRTFWVDKKYKYTISTTGFGFNYKLIKKPVNKYIMETSKLILDEIQKKFKQRLPIVRIDWGYNKEIGPPFYFVGEIEPQPGLYTEVYDNGNSRWTIDKELGDIYYQIATKK